METILTIALVLFTSMTAYFLVTIRAETIRERNERIANAERKRMIQRQITLAEGKIQWD